MDISRRQFIRKSSIAMAGTAMLPIIVNRRKIPGHVLGIQLYTVRDDMEKDPEGTLKSLAAMGYTYVEHAGYENRKFYSYTIADFKKLLHDTGLTMLSGHSFLGSRQWDKSGNDFTDDWKDTVRDAAAVGMKYLISPGVDEDLCKNAADFKRYMEMFNKAGELCQKAGITFAYHNESYEFNHSLDGTLLYDLLLASTDHALVAQQIDIGNMYEPGGRAADYLKRYPGRFRLMHVKDEIKKQKPGENGQLYESSVLGKGSVGINDVLELAARSGVTYFIVEQEDYQGKTPLECAAENLKAMHNRGF